jgi:hypothetical protein
MQPAAAHVDFTATVLVKNDHSGRNATGFGPPTIDTNRTVALPPVADSLFFWPIIGSARDLLYRPIIGGSADS